MKRPRILCSSSVAYAEDAFCDVGEIVVRDGRSITADDLKDVDIMVVRSTTKINRDLLANSSVKFVGTATIGTDHLDIPWLDDNGISWYNAPGCNSNSVSEYVTAAMLCLASKHNISLKDQTLGVIGVGNVGSKVVQKARALGMRVLMSDPPKQRAASLSENSAKDFGIDYAQCVTLDKLLNESDIITLHVPLTKEGCDKTFHMVDKAFFASMKSNSIFINSSRGPVVETTALIDAIKNKTIAHSIIDTWENEPDISRELLGLVSIGTPHIAGYSFDGKVNGTVMIYNKVCDYMGIDPTWEPSNLPEPPVTTISLENNQTSTYDEFLWNLVKQVYDIRQDHEALLLASKEEDIAMHFDNIRKTYHTRREFFSVSIANASENNMPTLTRLGFSLNTAS